MVLEKPASRPGHERKKKAPDKTHVQNKNDNVSTKTAHSTESGTEGPAGPLDDQPQREDEYLSKILKEFNPQRKDSSTPLPDVDDEQVNKP